MVFSCWRGRQSISEMSQSKIDKVEELSTKKWGNKKN